MRFYHKHCGDALQEVQVLSCPQAHKINGEMGLLPSMLFCWIARPLKCAPPPALPPLSFLGIAGREINEKWDDKGAGAVFFLQQEMSDAVTGGAWRKFGSLLVGVQSFTPDALPCELLHAFVWMASDARKRCLQAMPVASPSRPLPRADMLRWVPPDHPTVQCALREHSRWAGGGRGGAGSICWLRVSVAVHRAHRVLCTIGERLLHCCPANINALQAGGSVREGGPAAAAR